MHRSSAPASRHIARRLRLAAAGTLRLPVMLLAAAGALAPIAAMAPEPEPVPRRWQLDVNVGPLHVTTINVKDVGARSFAYLTYQVVNNSGQDVLFAPMWELSDGEGTIARSGREVPQAVTSQIVASVQNAFAQDQIEIIGELLQGEENAKYGVVVWALADTNAERVTVYAAGLSGETKTVASPDGKQQFVLRKTLRLEYDTPGNLLGQSSQPIPLRGKSWIMR
jgi:hypothetical protein